MATKKGKRKPRYRVGQDVLVPATIERLNDDAVTCRVEIDNTEVTVTVWKDSLRPLNARERGD